MAKKQSDSKRLLVISSFSPTGDADGPPNLDSAQGGVLAEVRALHEQSTWPEDLDLLVISDTYGLVEPDSPAGAPVPIPFTRTENPDWWAGFIARNLDNYITRRGHSSAFVLPEPSHEPALRASQRLRDFDTFWADTELDGLEAIGPWVGGEQVAPPKKRSPRRPAAAKARTAAEPAREAPLSRAQMLASSVVEYSIYSDRFILAISKMTGEEIDEVRRELSFEWSRRSQRRHERPSVSNFIARSARLPWSERPATTLYGRLFESFGMANVLGSINKAVSQLAITEPGRYRDILARMPKDESEFMTDVLHLLWEASSRMDKDEIALLRAYLSDSCTHDELRRLGLSRNLWLEDRYEILRSVVSCLVGLAPFGDISDYRRIWLRFDEIENILGYTYHDRWELVKALGTLIGDSPRCVTIWLNISPQSIASAAEIQAALENNLLITDDLTTG
jgi:hypothetical protein